MKRLASVFSVLALVALAGGACGDLEQDRICLNPPCKVPGQAKECAAYVACYYRTGGSPGSLDSTYGKFGTCWQNEATTSACTAACTSALSSFMSFDAGCPMSSP